MRFRQLPEPTDNKGRVETGPTRFGDDWTGIFMRGDDAFAYRTMLELAIRDIRDFYAKGKLEELCELLKQCDHKYEKENDPAEDCKYDRSIILPGEDKGHCGKCGR